MKIIIDAIDKTSLKLCGISATPLFINATNTLKVLSALAIISTVVYNSIRIYKELKNKQ